MKTAEFVSPMHPDKICDRISDAILDECLKQDPNSRVAIEVLGGHKKIVLIGELTTQANIDFKEIVLKELNDPSFEIIINITEQSTSIAQGVDIGGAGDQGIMIGYACRDTINFMPLEYELSRSLCKYIFQFHPYDGKTQITIDDEKKITDIVVSFQNVSKSDLKTLTLDWLKLENINYSNNLKFWINESGDWTVGGFDGDTGLTGRKIVIDAYGPNVAVGGGAFSGKDPTKVDRSGALMARKVAVELLNNIDGVYSVLVKVAYAIGKKEPIMLTADIVFKNEIDSKSRTHFNLLHGQIRNLKNTSSIAERFYPENIAKELNLKNPQYKELSKWGHFGNNNLWDK